MTSFWRVLRVASIVEIAFYSVQVSGTRFFRACTLRRRDILLEIGDYYPDPDPECVISAIAHYYHHHDKSQTIKG